MAHGNSCDCIACMTMQVLGRNPTCTCEGCMHTREQLKQMWLDSFRPLAEEAGRLGAQTMLTQKVPTEEETNNLKKLQEEGMNAFLSKVETFKAILNRELPPTLFGKEEATGNKPLAN